MESHVTDAPSFPEIVHACAQALANDVWHPPQRLDTLPPHDVNKFKRQARLVLEAAASLQPATPTATGGDDPVAFITKAGLENWLHGDDSAEKHVLLRTGNDMRVALYTRPAPGGDAVAGMSLEKPDGWVVKNKHGAIELFLHHERALDAFNAWGSFIGPVYQRSPDAAATPMQADIAQIISDGWSSGKTSAEVSDAVLREFDDPAQRPMDPATVEACAKHIEHEADVATNSLHCGDNSQTIAATHRVSRAYYEAAKSIRSLALTFPQDQTP